MRYAVVIEKGESSYGAYVPDLSGCVAAGDTREEVVTLIQEAIEFHIVRTKKRRATYSCPYLKCRIHRRSCIARQ